MSTRKTPYERTTGTNPFPFHYTGARNPFNARVNEIGRQLNTHISTDAELEELLAPFAQNSPAKLAALKRNLIATAEANVPAVGRMPLLGETPEESGTPAYQTLRLPAPFSVRFFAGAGRRGMLFFDFVDDRTGRLMNLPHGYTVHQQMPGEGVRLLPLHEALNLGGPADYHQRFALLEGTQVILKMPNGAVHPFISPTIPRDEHCR